MLNQNSGRKERYCSQLTWWNGENFKIWHFISGMNENQEYMCDVCGKSFHCVRYLLNHKKRLHVGDKAHQCTECGKMFRLKQTLSEHMEIHISKEYECGECGKHFRHYRSYRRHIKAHKETEPFPCPRCGKRYKNKKSAEPHMKACQEKDNSPSVSSTGNFHNTDVPFNPAVLPPWRNAFPYHMPDVLTTGAMSQKYEAANVLATGLANQMMS